MSADEQARLQRRLKISNAFSPGAPIDAVALFAGRTKQLERVLQEIASRGRHVVIFGERGVGKTSLARNLVEVCRGGQIQTLAGGTVNCSAGDTFASVWRRAFEDLHFQQTSQGIGLQPEPTTTTHSASAIVGSLVAPSGEARELEPEDVRRVLSFFQPSMLVIDEVDRIRDAAFSGLMADTLKSLSDHLVNTTIILIGVADSVDHLIAEHASIERSLAQVHMPRMSVKELLEILDKAYKSANLTASPTATAKIASFSRGLPHFTHLLGREAGLHADSAGRTEVTADDVTDSLESAIKNTEQSIQKSYHDATFSPRQRTYYPSVLLACALVQTDELGYFAATDLRSPLSRIVGKQMEIPAFAQHLNDFSSDARGRVLQKAGQKRRFRYRFTNPLLQPYVILKGVRDGLVTDAMLAESESRSPIR